MKKISVVIPCFNAEKTIEDTVKSVLNQSYLPSEIILIDDCSDDNNKTLDKLYMIQKKYEHLIEINIIVQKINQGVSVARNVGMIATKYSYIALLDSDDVWYPEKLEKQMAILSLDNRIGLIGTAFNGKIYKYILYRKKKCDCYSIPLVTLIFKNFFSPSTVIIRKEVVKNIGYFNEKKRYGEDVEYFLRIADKYKCIFVNKNLVECGHGKPLYGHSGLSSNLIEMEKAELKNIRYVYNMDKISVFIYCIAVLYSLIKFARRIIITICRKIKGEK